MVKSRTVIATPPGETIREQLENRSIKQKEFASRMGMTEKHISRLINGELRLTPDVALKLEMVLGIPAEVWGILEENYQEKAARAAREPECPCCTCPFAQKLSPQTIYCPFFSCAREVLR